MWTSKAPKISAVDTLKMTSCSDLRKLRRRDAIQVISAGLSMTTLTKHSVACHVPDHCFTLPILGALSGPFSPLCADFLAGALLAFETRRERYGRTLTGDTRSDPTKAVQLLSQYADVDRASGFLLGDNGGVSSVARTWAEQKRIPVISGVSTNQGLTESRNEWFFRISPRESDLAAAAANFLRARQGAINGVAVLVAQESQLPHYRAAISAAGGTAAFSESATLESLAGKLRGQRLTAILIVGFPGQRVRSALSELRTESAFRQLPTVIVDFAAVQTAENQAPDEQMLLVTANHLPATLNATQRSAKAEFERKWPARQFTGQASVGYAAAVLAMDAFKTANPGTRSGSAAQFRDQILRGASASEEAAAVLPWPIRFDPITHQNLGAVPFVVPATRRA